MVCQSKNAREYGPNELPKYVSAFRRHWDQSLLEETRRLKAQVLESNAGKPIRLTSEERRRLDAMRKRIDPDILKNIDLLADAE